jgi:iron-only hydrogenase group A
MANMVNLKINDIPLKVSEDTTLLEAAKMLNIKVPTLCQHPDLLLAGNCRICVVEVKGSRTLQASCCTPVRDGMDVFTNTQMVRRSRRHTLSLLLSEHNNDCVRCYKNGNCELQALAMEYGIEGETFIDISGDTAIDMSSPSIMKDDSKCIKCQRCVRTCQELQQVSALAVAHKGNSIKLTTFMEKPLHFVVCTNCGQCVNRCPTGALIEKSYISEVWNALDDPAKHVVVQTAPAVRVALGETLGYDPGERVTGKMVTALRRLGFDSVFDTNFTADLTIMEEGTELLMRLKSALADKNPAALPQFTSCSPGWIKYIEHEFPDILDYLSTCKSPQQMFGAIAKTYYAQKSGIDPKDIIVVSVMPCTAKKFEANRPEMNSSGYQDVDYVITTRELGRMIREAGIDFKELEAGECDSLLGKHTGAAVIFGATGGVMEAALRTAYEIITGREVPFDNLNITPVRGMEGVREATIKIEGCVPDWSFLEGAELKVAIAHGLSNARKVTKQVAEGKSPYHFIEIMACPGGCIGGGGQPIPTSLDIRQLRMDAIYNEDGDLPLRKSHENPEITRIYSDFLGKPLSHKSHELLHTHYTKRKW